ncbi:MAG: TetR/AcrR family transcriptional regulator [Oceanospirillaceae bacterium]|nr:TetR/AcrR family transcriptional regulator [Oceanospirillaceae bacterium]
MQNKTDKRQQLIDAARQLFVAMPYAQVSVRQIAREAQVDAALVRYYFTNKAGIFEAMLRETVEPMLAAVQEVLANNAACDIEHLGKVYYQHVIRKAPAMPRMVMRILHDPQEQEPFIIMFRVFSQIIELFRQWMQASMQASMQDAGLLRTDIDPDLARLSFISLTVFPLLAPPVLMQQFGFTPSPERLTELARHNRIILTQGILKPAQETQDE